MSSDKHKRSIIVIKRPVKAASHHGGAWKIAFADFMTAMFAFFLVMWLLSSSTPKQLAGIAAEFKMPLKVAMTGGTKSSISASVIPGGGDSPVRLDGESSKSDSDSKSLETLKKRLDDLIESNPVLKQFKPQLMVDITPEGLRIQIIDSNKRPMFERSSAVVATYMRSILRELGPVLSEQPNKLTLSGHTDATQYSAGDKSYSNWELSSERANASRRELVSATVKDDRILRVIGVSSSVNLNVKDPFAAENRRISIVILNKKTQEMIENLSTGSAGATGATGATSSDKATPEVPAK
jgi:chemotaxis protein MotB